MVVNVKEVFPSTVMFGGGYVIFPPATNSLPVVYVLKLLNTLYSHILTIQVYIQFYGSDLVKWLS